MWDKSITTLLSFSTLVVVFISNNLTAADTLPTALQNIDIKSALSGLCSSNPNLITCSLQTYCNKGSVTTSNQYCSDISLLATLCLNDGSQNSVCSAFNSTCPEGSSSSGCSSAVALPGLLTAENMFSRIQVICKTMVGIISI